MPNDRLRALLHEALSTTGRGPAAVDLHQMHTKIAARRRQARRRAVLAATASITAVALLLTAKLWSSRSDRPAGDIASPSAGSPSSNIPEVASASDHVAPRKGPAELKRQLAVQHQIVEQLQALEQLEQSRRQLAELEARAAANSRQLDASYQHYRAASLALLYANQLRTQAGRRDEALAEYAWVAEHFADTPWAEQARRQLETLPGS